MPSAGVGDGQGFTCGQASDGQRRVVSSADFHGDWDHALEHLTAVGIVANGKWAGGDTTFVYTGDIVDRGDHGKALWELMFKLQDEAPISGGQVILLLGNHELMNLQMDLRYVSQNDFATYGGRAGHTKAWAPDGAIGRELRRRCQAAALVADVVYVHAGLLPSMLSEFAPGVSGETAISMLNEKVRSELAGDAASIRRSRSSLLADEGPFWTRTLSLDRESRACALLEKTLQILQVRRMVVGHTPQQSGSIVPRCGGRLLLADTFMSQAYTGSASQSVHNEASVEFYGDSSTASAVYPKRAGGTCLALPLDAEFLKDVGSLRSATHPSVSPIASTRPAHSSSLATVLPSAVSDVQTTDESMFGSVDVHSVTLLFLGILIVVALILSRFGRACVSKFSGAGQHKSVPD